MTTMHSPTITSLLNTGNPFSTPSYNASEGPTLDDDSRTRPTDVEVHTNTSTRDSFELFNRILQSAYQRIAIGPSEVGSINSANDHASTSQSTAPPYQTTEKTTATQASGTILNFINQQLQMDKANGASKEDLMSRLDAGLNGFIKGFNAAKTQIEDMGLLIPDTAAKINDTYDRVSNGIEQLRNNITNDGTNLARFTLDSEHSQQDSFSLQLITQDGDTVSIEISRLTQLDMSASIDLEKLTIAYNQSSFSSNSFSFVVSGELDEGELASINQLLQSVDSIASDFYQGRVDEAFQQTLDLEFDSTEFARLDLNLQQTTASTAVAAYKSTASSNSHSSDHGPSQLSQLLGHLKKTFDAARNFQEPLKLLNEALSGLDRYHDRANQINNVDGQHTAEILANLMDNMAQRYFNT
ncbi:MAG: hypothetical protein ACI8XC_004350 [Gammaproteobacteria bacterium]|jgi:hypothetical protein